MRKFEGDDEAVTAISYEHFGDKANIPEILAFATKSFHIFLADADTGTHLRAWRPHNAFPTVLQFYLAPSILSSSATAREFVSMSSPLTAAASSFPADGAPAPAPHLLALYADGAARGFDLAAPATTHLCRLGEPGTAVAIVPRGDASGYADYVFVGGRDGTVAVAPAAPPAGSDGAVMSFDVTIRNAHSSAVTGVSASPLGDVVVTVSGDGLAAVWAMTFADGSSSAVTANATGRGVRATAAPRGGKAAGAPRRAALCRLVNVIVGLSMTGCISTFVAPDATADGVVSVLGRATGASDALATNTTTGSEVVFLGCDPTIGEDLAAARTDAAAASHRVLRAWALDRPALVAAGVAQWTGGRVGGTIVGVPAAGTAATATHSAAAALPAEHRLRQSVIVPSVTAAREVDVPRYMAAAPHLGAIVMAAHSGTITAVPLRTVAALGDDVTATAAVRGCSVVPLSSTAVTTASGAPAAVAGGASGLLVGRSVDYAGSLGEIVGAAVVRLPGAYVGRPSKDAVGAWQTVVAAGDSVTCFTPGRAAATRLPALRSVPVAVAASPAGGLVAIGYRDGSVVVFAAVPTVASVTARLSAADPSASVAVVGTAPLALLDSADRAVAPARGGAAAAAISGNDASGAAAGPVSIAAAAASCENPDAAAAQHVEWVMVDAHRRAHTTVVAHIVFTSDDLLVSVDQSGIGKVWRVQRAKGARLSEIADAAAGVRTAVLAATSADAKQGKEARARRAAVDVAVASLVALRGAIVDGTRVACGGTLQLHSDAAEALAAAPGGVAVATGGSDASKRLLKLWAVHKDALVPVAALQRHRKPIRCVAFGTTGDAARLLASASSDGSVYVWRVVTGGPYGVAGLEMLRTLVGATAPLSVCFSGTSAHALVADNDGTVRVWDATSGALTSTTAAHDGRVWATCVAPSVSDAALDAARHTHEGAEALHTGGAHAAFVTAGSDGCLLGWVDETAAVEVAANRRAGAQLLAIQSLDKAMTRGDFVTAAALALRLGHQRGAHDALASVWALIAAGTGPSEEQLRRFTEVVLLVARVCGGDREGRRARKGATAGDEDADGAHDDGTDDADTEHDDDDDDDEDGNGEGKGEVGDVEEEDTTPWQSVSVGQHARRLAQWSLDWTTTAARHEIGLLTLAALRSAVPIPALVQQRAIADSVGAVLTARAAVAVTHAARHERRYADVHERLLPLVMAVHAMVPVGADALLRTGGLPAVTVDDAKSSKKSKVKSSSNDAPRASKRSRSVEVVAAPSKRKH